MTTVSVKIDCEACVKVIRTLPGVKSISSAGKIATVVCDNKDKEKVKSEIKKAWYSVL